MRRAVLSNLSDYFTLREIQLPFKTLFSPLLYLLRRSQIVQVLTTSSLAEREALSPLTTVARTAEAKTATRKYVKQDRRGYKVGC
jgi:hypothetical protein